MAGDVRLRDTTAADVEIFFAHRQQAAAVGRARLPTPDRRAYLDYWADHVLGDETAHVQTVTVGGQVAGNLLAWWRDDRRYLGGWFSQDFWGRGVGTRALLLFLEREPVRPLYADTAVTNTASRRLLERCGFQRTGLHDASLEYVLR